VNYHKVIAKSVLSIGVLSKGSAEPKIKYFHQDSQFNTQKLSREATMADLFNRQLVNSDPQLSSFNLKDRIKRHEWNSLPK
jgi:hypothetical protein